MNGWKNGYYKPPFPYFGGKSAVAGLIWSALGDVKNYVEPFFGSGATLFLRPQVGAIETINDADGFICNVWRAIKTDPDAVVEHADNQVSECDLHARHLWLIGQRERLTDKLCGDPDFCDPKAAGWWVWGQCCWIGSGWCSGRGPWQSVNGVLTDARSKENGVWRQLPHLGSTGQGVNRKLPHLRNTGKGACAERREWLRGYLRWFADRLRGVRVCCGDWSRVCGPSVTFRHGLTGVYLDPPYADTAKRTSGLYAVDCQRIAHDVREWALENGNNPLMRIVLSGYDIEHESLDGWKSISWKSSGGYSLAGQDDSKGGRRNRIRERLWLSPHCIVTKEMSFFCLESSDDKDVIVYDEVMI